MHSTLQEQSEIAIKAIVSLVNFVFEQKEGAVNRTQAIMNDDAFVHKATLTCVQLIKPTSLPGFLLVTAVILRIVHAIALSVTCHKALARAGAKAENGKVE